MPLDIGIGILAAIIVSKVFSLELSPLLVGLGIALALLPDIDFLYVLLRQGPRNVRAIIRHRDLVHYPLLYLPLGALAASLFGPEWIALFLLTSLGHFVHDSIGLGWGIPWLWPFVDRNYTFFYRYAPAGKPLPRRMLYRWERTAIDQLIAEHRDPHWLKNIYLRLHPIFMTEVFGFLFAVWMLWKIASVYAGN